MSSRATEAKAVVMNGKAFEATAAPKPNEGEGTAKGEAAQRDMQASQKRKRETERSTPTLSWMRVPVEIKAGTGVPLSAVRGLHSLLHSALTKGGYEELFPVQAASWRTLAGGMSSAHDLCICAPTGSGKTLAYALPILQRLIGLARGKLGALVVLPTRELALQIYNVFAALCPSAGLWVGLAAAQLPLPAEAAALREGQINILIATPGRLMSHLKAANLTVVLTDLEFLVVDETDRMLRQSYQDWLPFVMEAIRQNANRGEKVVKVVASATLTQDPAKLQRLELHAPRYIAMSSTDNRYKVPKKLKEFKVIGAAVDKPVLLCAVLEAHKLARIIVFTASLAANHRLFLMLQEIFKDDVLEHSSSSHSKQQAKEQVLSAFRKGSSRILVTSDALTRGLDISGVDLVINYDTPTYPKTYVHRAGRTARAGNEGTVITLLSTEQVYHYKAMLRKIDNTFVRDLPLQPGTISALRPKVKQAIDSIAKQES